MGSKTVKVPIGMRSSYFAKIKTEPENAHPTYDSKVDMGAAVKGYVDDVIEPSETRQLVAAALEMIHTASLIHDDMPEMDDDDLRRGRPSCHKVYGPAMALLAGDGLFIHAFAVLSRPLPGADAGRQLAAVREIALRSGLGGMVSGQAAEWDNMTRPVDRGLLEYISRGKTSALLIAAVKAAGLLAGADEEKLQALEDYGRHAGLAFQIIDDVLDVEGDDASLGKPAGSDQERGLVTFASLLGCAEARREAGEEAAAAVSALARFGPEADTLRAFPPFFVSRRH